MRILLGSFLGEHETIEVPADTWISPRSAADAPGIASEGSAANGAEGPKAPPENWLDRLRAGVKQPLGLPPLSQTAFAGDRVVVTLDPQTPQAEGIAIELLRELRSLGIEAKDLTLLLAAGASRELLDRLSASAPAAAGPEVTVARHDPADRERLGYLAADARDNPIYLRREILDADVIVPISVARPASPLPDDSANGGLFPTFSDRDSIVRFAELRRQGDLAEVRDEARQANWLLGTQFAVAVAPASGEDAGQIVAGEMNAVLKASETAVAATWSLEMPDPAGLSVACLAGPEEQQTWENLGRALATADACTKEKGAIVLLTAIDRPPGAGAAIEASGGVGELSDSGVQDDEDDLYAAERRAREAERAVPYWRRALDEALERRTVYLASRLPEETVEDLGMVPLTKTSELQTLVERFGGCIWIRDGQFVAWAVEASQAEAPRPRRKRKS